MQYSLKHSSVDVLSRPHCLTCRLSLHFAAYLTVGLVFFGGLSVVCGQPRPPDHASDVGGSGGRVVVHPRPPTHNNLAGAQILNTLYGGIPTGTESSKVSATTKYGSSKLDSPPMMMASSPPIATFPTSVDKERSQISEQTDADKPPVPISRYKILTVSFGRVETPFIIGLWIFCASLAKIGFHMAPKLNEIFPESCLLIVVGVVIGVILVHVTNSFHMSPFTPDTFFFYMLPPIILDAGYFMPNRLFFDHLGPILLFAVVGTIFNTLAIGVSLWAVGLTGLFSCDTQLLDMFLFGSLISAVDPVAVLAVFEEIQVNEILYIVVFGESLLNDAVTVVLYNLFDTYKSMGLENIVYVDMLAGFANFLVVALGGTIIGVLWGFATGFVTKFTNEVRVIEPIFIFVMAYLGYLNAEVFHMSGILAITFCGITMKNYVEANVSHKSHTTIKYAMKMLSSSSETIIFMFLGVATINKRHDWNTWFVIFTIIFCSIYRVIGVIILTAFANRFRLHQMSPVEKFVMSYGGLRGAVAFALVLLIDPHKVKLQPMFMTTTIAVIYFTVFFQGITIKPLVKMLNVKTAEKRKPTMNERIHERLMDHSMAALEDLLGQHGNYHIRDKFKRFDNRFIRPYLLRNHQLGAEPKIIETYSKLAMRDAMEYMRRNASTIGNIANTESMSAIFKNYSHNMNGSMSHLDSSTWNIDMQELEYNPSKKDLTDAKIHHLLSEELVKPSRRHRKLSYSRHAVDDRDLSTQVNYRMHFNMRRLVGDKKHHHKRHSKKMHRDGKQNHVSFPEFQQNGTAKHFTHDYINEVLHEDDINTEPKLCKEDWDSPITFTAKSSRTYNILASTETDVSGSFASQLVPLMGVKSKGTLAEGCLPWRLSKERSGPNVTDESMLSDSGKRCSRGSFDGSDLMRVTTPTATETVLPWKRNEEEDTVPIQQNEFPAWASNKEYLAYNSPSATFLGGLENPRTSVFGLFRRESAGSVEHSPSLAPLGGGAGGATSHSSTETTPQRERRHSLSRGSTIGSVTNIGFGTGSGGMLLVQNEDGTTLETNNIVIADPLGVQQKPCQTSSSPLNSVCCATLPPPPSSTSSQAPQTPGQRRQNRRGSSMLELSGSITRDTIPEEPLNRRRPSWLPPAPPPPPLNPSKSTTNKTQTLGSKLMMDTSTPSSTEENSENEDIECLMKATGF